MVCGLSGTACGAERPAPETENGRYTLSTVPDGVIRLDTRTGEVTNCANDGNGWACTLVPDERAAYDAEIGRLQAENEKLKQQLVESGGTVSGKTNEAMPKSDSLKKAEPKAAESPNKIEIPLPSDQDMNRMMSFLEQAWRRLVDIANRMQGDSSGRI
ncbi:MAG TPA: hypothetical protein VMU69_18320 [Bradyrhizobium sp.]|nr:hypothetical protein [Bradyrhizobium sp.]